MKPGVKSTEFWVTIGSMGGVLMAFLKQNCDIDSGKIVALAISLATAAGVYTWSRTQVKTKDDKS